MRDTEEFIKEIESQIILQFDNKQDDDLPNVWFAPSDAVGVVSHLRHLYEIKVLMFNRCKALTGVETCDICKYQEECFKEHAKREGGSGK